MEINKVYVKKRTDFGKQCLFDVYGPKMDLMLPPEPVVLNDYILRTHCPVGLQNTTQLALHEAQTTRKISKVTGMYHCEGGWPREINPKDEEATMRFRRRIEKDDNWAPKMRPLINIMDHGILQNGAMNIYQHYFDDMIPTPLVQHHGLRTANVYIDPEIPVRPVRNISWSSDSGSRIAVCYCSLKFDSLTHYSNRIYIWQVDNPIEPYMALEPPCPCGVCEFNHRDPSVLVSGLTSGQVCNWDLRTGTKPVQSSHLQFSHREATNGVKWIPTKNNTDFFSTSTDGRAMWWDTRWLHQPSEVLVFDLEEPNVPHLDRAIGISSLNFGPIVGTKFMFGMDNGKVITGSRKAKTNAEKLAARYHAHIGPVVSVDRNAQNPAVFLTVGDWTARVWAEDTREGNLIATRFLSDYPTGACWNKQRQSVFNVITSSGKLLVWDLLQNLRRPILKMRLCEDSLTTMAPCDHAPFLALGNSVGKVYIVETNKSLQTFGRKDRGLFSEYLDRCSKLTKAVDIRLREIKLTQRITAGEQEEADIAQDVTRFRGTHKGNEQSIKHAYPKEKHRRKGKNRDRQSESESRERRKSGGLKERKRGRDEFPEMMEAEQKFFEMVEQEIDKYEAENDPDVCPVRQVHVVSKKQDRKRRKSQDNVHPAKGHSAKDEKGRSKTARIPKPPANKPPRPRASHKTLMSMSRISEISEEVVMDDSWHEMEASTEARKKHKPKIRFFLPDPCKTEICKPKICCQMKKRKKPEKTFKEGKRLTTSPMSPLRVRSSVIKEMLSPPLELQAEVLKAKKEIMEAQGISTRIEVVDRKQKRPVRRVSQRKKSQSTKRKSVRLAGTKVPDPCSPWETTAIEDKFSEIVGVPVPAVPKEEVEGKDNSKKLEKARARVYPRISEFQTLD